MKFAARIRPLWLPSFCASIARTPPLDRSGMLTTKWNPLEIDGNQGDVVFLGAALGSSRPAGQLGEECGEHGSGPETRLTFKESEESGGAKFFLCGVLRFEGTVRIENAAITRPKRTFDGGVGSLFGDAEQQAIRLDFAEGFSLASVD